MEVEPKFTVVVGTARGAYEDIEEAKEEARRLYRLNSPEPVAIFDVGGRLVFEIHETTEEEKEAFDGG